MKIQFGSDNEAPVRQEIMDAIARANEMGPLSSYGEDEITRGLDQRFSELFEKEVQVFPVITGTAANALGLTQITPSYGAVLCHEHAHINLDECGAVEFFSGAKLELLSGTEGKLNAGEVRKTFETAHPHAYHNSRIMTVSLTQATEYGTVYTKEEIKEISNIAHEYGARLHMDGARFANALATQQCTPAQLTWRAGVDILSFGASKNGAMHAEAIIVFNSELAVELKRRLKQAGQVTSKMRYVSCQLEAYIEDGRWLDWARYTNTLALTLANEMEKSGKIQIALPVQSNILILRMEASLAHYLWENGIGFYPWPEIDGCYRVVLSNVHTESDITLFRDILNTY